MGSWGLFPQQGSLNESFMTLMYDINKMDLIQQLKDTSIEKALKRTGENVVKGTKRKYRVSVA